MSAGGQRQSYYMGKEIALDSLNGLHKCLVHQSQT